MSFDKCCLRRGACTKLKHLHCERNKSLLYLGPHIIGVDPCATLYSVYHIVCKIWVGFQTDAVASFWCWCWCMLMISRFLLSMDVIVCLYAIVLLVFLIINLASGRSILEAPKRGMTVILYFVDHVSLSLTILLLSTLLGWMRTQYCALSDTHTHKKKNFQVLQLSIDPASLRYLLLSACELVDLTVLQIALNRNSMNLTVPWWVHTAINLSPRASLWLVHLQLHLGSPWTKLLEIRT